MKILIIPEDQEHDRHIVEPVVGALVKDAGFKADVHVLAEPRLRGTGDALSASLIREVITDNPMVDLFLLIVDRDCNRERNVEKAAARETEHTGQLIHCLAVQEVEVWMLALYKGELPVRFSQVREHCDPKEEYAAPLLEKLGTHGPGRGRKRAMKALRGKWRSLRDTCTELRDLQSRIEAWRSARSAS